MQEELHGKIFDRFVSRLYEKGLLVDYSPNEIQRTMASLLPKVKDEFKAWQDIIQFRHATLSEESQHGYKEVFLVVGKARTHESKKRTNKHIPVFVIGVYPDMSVSAMAGVVKSGFFNIDPFPDQNGMVSLLEQKDLYVERPSQIGEFLKIPQHVRKNFSQDTNRLGNITRAVVRVGRFKNDKKVLAKIESIASSSAYEVLTEEMDVFFEKFKKGYVQSEYEFAERFVSEIAKAQFYTPIQIYNHILCAGDRQKRDFRKGAILAIADAAKDWERAPFLFGVKKFWKVIDSGKSPFKAAAGYFEIKESTAKKIYKSQPWLSKKENIAKYSPYLDVLDFSRWPENDQGTQTEIGDAAFFVMLVEAAEIYGRIFVRDPKEVLKNWTSQFWRESNNTWSGMARCVLRKNYDNVFNLLSEGNIDSRKRDHRSANLVQIFNEISRTKKCHNNPKDLERQLQEEFSAHSKLVSAVLEDFKRVLKEIEDMKSDISRRIVKPGILLALTAEGFRVTEFSVLKDIEEKIWPNLWGRMFPSDQIAASSYWHSPAVAINRRRKAVLMSNVESEYSEWPPLFDNPVKVNEGVVAVSLNTVEKLTAEGEAMNHCVWSYGPNCFEYNYSNLN